MLTVRAERRPVELGEQADAQLSERPLGIFARPARSVRGLRYRR